MRNVLSAGLSCALVAADVATDVATENLANEHNTSDTQEQAESFPIKLLGAAAAVALASAALWTASRGKKSSQASDTLKLPDEKPIASEVKHAATTKKGKARPNAAERAAAKEAAAAEAAAEMAAAEAQKKEAKEQAKKEAIAKAAAEEAEYEAELAAQAAKAKADLARAAKEKEVSRQTDHCC